MDLRALRTQFFAKKLEYACSCDSTLTLTYGDLTCGRSRLRSTLTAGAVFNVLGDRRVPGLDGRGYDSPKGHIKSLDETVTFAGNRTVGSIEGRMIVETIDKVVLYLTYDGVLQLGDDLSAVRANDVEGRACISAQFETSHPKYHWLVEHAAVAFGTWRATNANGEQSVVEACYDIYSAD